MALKLIWHGKGSLPSVPSCSSCPVLAQRPSLPDKLLQLAERNPSALNTVECLVDRLLEKYRN